MVASLADVLLQVTLTSEVALYSERCSSLDVQLEDVNAALDTAKTAFLNLEWQSNETINGMKAERRERQCKPHHGMSGHGNLRRILLVDITSLQRKLKKASERSSVTKVDVSLQTSRPSSPPLETMSASFAATEAPLAAVTAASALSLADVGDACEDPVALLSLQDARPSSPILEAMSVSFGTTETPFASAAATTASALVLTNTRDACEDRAALFGSQDTTNTDQGSPRQFSSTARTPNVPTFMFTAHDAPYILAFLLATIRHHPLIWSVPARAAGLTSPGQSLLIGHRAARNSMSLSRGAISPSLVTPFPEGTSSHAARTVLASRIRGQLLLYLKVRRPMPMILARILMSRSHGVRTAGC